MSLEDKLSCYKVLTLDKELNFADSHGKSVYVHYIFKHSSESDDNFDYVLGSIAHIDPVTTPRRISDSKPEHYIQLQDEVCRNQIQELAYKDKLKAVVSLNNTKIEVESAKSFKVGIETPSSTLGVEILNSKSSAIECQMNLTKIKKANIDLSDKDKEKYKGYFVLTEIIQLESTVSEEASSQQTGLLSPSLDLPANAAVNISSGGIKRSSSFSPCVCYSYKWELVGNDFLRYKTAFDGYSNLVYTFQRLLDPFIVGICGGWWERVIMGRIDQRIASVMSYLVSNGKTGLITVPHIKISFHTLISKLQEYADYLQTKEDAWFVTKNGSFVNELERLAEFIVYCIAVDLVELDLDHGVKRAIRNNLQASRNHLGKIKIINWDTIKSAIKAKKLEIESLKVNSTTVVIPIVDSGVQYELGPFEDILKKLDVLDSVDLDDATALLNNNAIILNIGKDLVQMFNTLSITDFQDAFEYSRVKRYIAKSKSSWTTFFYYYSNNLGKSDVVLGICHLFGIGTPKSMHQALNYFKSGMNSGTDKYAAYYFMGTLYRIGWGIEVDPDTAFKYFVKSSFGDDYKDNLERDLSAPIKLGRNGFNGSLFYIGYCAQNGFGTTLDYEFALSCFEKTVDEQHATGCYFTGALSKMCNKVNDVELLDILNIAKKGGSIAAQQKLAKLIK